MATKSAKAAAKTAPDPSNKIIAAALDLAAEQGWPGVTLRAVAERAGLTLAALRHHVDSRGDLLSAWSRQIDERILVTVEPHGAPRDRLFDLLMERFECMNEHRAGALAVLRGLRTDPHAAATGLRALSRAMHWTLEAAGLDTTGPKGALRLAAATGLYLHTLRTWMGDDSADLSATMAALDKNIGRATSWGARFGFAEGDSHG